jgi:hypothetical protein
VAPAAPTAPVSGDEELLRAMLAAAAARPSLAQPLRGARARLVGSTLTLEVAADFAALASTHCDEYRELASKAAGRALKVEVTAGQSLRGEDEAPPSQAEIKRERLMKEAAREPAVQEALDLFGGRVVDVRDAKP